MMLMMTSITLLMLTFLEGEGCAGEACDELRLMLITMPSVNKILTQGVCKYLRGEPLSFSGEL